MKKYVNLMTDVACYRNAARVTTRRWITAGAACLLIAAPTAFFKWEHCRQVSQEYDALEASYEPVRRLNGINMQLRTTAAALVRDNRLPLELSRRRPVTTLLGIASGAAAQSEGALFINHIEISQTPAGGDGAAQQADRMTIEAACTLKYDIANFVAALTVAPVSAVKIVTDDLAVVDGIDRKTYTVECVLGSPPAGGSHVN